MRAQVLLTVCRLNDTHVDPVAVRVLDVCVTVLLLDPRDDLVASVVVSLAGRGFAPPEANDVLVRAPTRQTDGRDVDWHYYGDSSLLDVVEHCVRALRSSGNQVA